MILVPHVFLWLLVPWEMYHFSVVARLFQKFPERKIRIFMVTQMVCHLGIAVFALSKLISL